jgi:hypothetical protein
MDALKNITNVHVKDQILKLICFQYRGYFNIITSVSVTFDRVLDWILDLSITLTHNS